MHLRQPTVSVGESSELLRTAFEDHVGSRATQSYRRRLRGDVTGAAAKCVPIAGCGLARARPYIGAAFGAACHAAGNGALRRSESC